MLTAPMVGNGGTLNNSGGTVQLLGGLSGFGNVDTLGNLNNTSGTVEATGGGTITMNGFTITNKGLLQATGGSTLNILFSGIDNAGGTIAANAGQVILGFVTLTGGTTEARNGGTVQLGGTTIVGGTLNNVGGTIAAGCCVAATLDGSTAAGAVTIQGTYTINAFGQTNILGTINNQGDIQLASGINSTLYAPGAAVLNNLNTIEGVGSINGNLAVTNATGAIINANVPSGGTGQALLVDAALGIANRGLMEATGGGMLSICCSTIDNAGGTIAANAGQVFVGLATVTGGTTEALNGGTVLLAGTTIVGGTLKNMNGTIGTGCCIPATLDGSSVAGAVTIQGTYTSDTNGTSLLGTINNQGNILVNSGGGGDAHLTLAADTTLQGGGTVTLANGGGVGTSFIDASASGLTLTNVDNTIHGTGTISGIGKGLQLVNQAGGTILADVPGQILAINAAPLMNSGTVQVSAGSTLQVIASFTQTGGKTQVDGTLLASLGLNASGGTVLGAGIINGNVTLTGGTIQPGSLSLPGTLTINGTYSHSMALFNELIGKTGNGLLAINGSSLLGPGSQLNINLLTGFMPSSGQTYTIMNYFTGSGRFTNAPTTGFQMDGFNWTIQYNATNVVLDAVSPVTTTVTPEPGSLLLFGTGLAALTGALRKKKRGGIV
jgi:hypothetical protein